MLGSAFTTRLEFDDIVSDLPVGPDDVGVDGLMSACLSRRVNVGDTAQQLLICSIGSTVVHCVSPSIIMTMPSAQLFSSAPISIYQPLQSPLRMLLEAHRLTV
jgi:hypothetical protein